MKKKYFIYHHLGLGDHIILNGLIRNIVDTKSIYFIFCKKQNIDSIEFMFNDLPSHSINVKVSKKSTQANYFIDNIEAVKSLLKALIS